MTDEEIQDAIAAVDAMSPKEAAERFKQMLDDYYPRDAGNQWKKYKPSYSIRFVSNPPVRLGGLHEAGERAIARVNAMRETLLEAFIAETGLMPSECEIVQVNEPDQIRWFVRRRADAP